jgi:glycosyltransferase involved in cell wall biosynthesis
MRIGISTFGGDGGKSGISRYIIKLIEHLALISPNDRFEVIAFADEIPIFCPHQADNVEMLPVDAKFRSPVRNILWHQWPLGRLCHSRRYDVLFLPAANRRLPLHVPLPTVGTVHDFSSLHVEGKYDPARMFYIKRVLPFLIRRLSQVLTVSESSKRDIVQYARVPERRVTVTYLAAEQGIYAPGDRAESRNRIIARYPVRGPYILYISRLEHPGKNHVRLIRAFEQMKTRTGLPHQLVLAGSKWAGSEPIHTAAAESPFTRDIIFPGFVKEEDLGHLYRGADLFVFPSQYEGFGLPVLEAMACGVPVACSNVSSMPEVAGSAGRYFSPQSIEEMTLAMEAILTDPSEAQRLASAGMVRARTFDWNTTARQTLDVLRQAANEKER